MENTDVISEATGLDLRDAEREQATGTFKIDLTAQDGSGGRVVIENQLERSDHDHLGKLLTYLVGLQAQRAIWIVADPRPEHARVIAWLNESSSAEFYLIKIEAVRIGSSEPAPLLTLIAGPSEETSDVRTEMADRERQRLRFFKRLLSVAKQKTSLHAPISPGKWSWIGAGAGVTGVSYNYVVRQHDARVEVYIDTPDGSVNRRIFDQLYKKKEKIEETFGSSLEWDTKEGRRACRIQKTSSVGGYRDEDRWKDVHEDLSTAMKNLEAAIKPHIKTLQLS